MDSRIKDLGKELSNMKEYLPYIVSIFVAIISGAASYFAAAKKKIEDGNLKYTEDRVFQNELLRTLTLVFENDFKEYL